jgi:ABC-type transporter Mla subunit MlaD
MLVNENTIQNVDIQDLPNANNFLSKVSVLSNQLPAILDDFKKYYVFYNKTPEYDEYKQMFENIKANLNTTNSSLAKINKSVDSATEDINEKLVTLNKLIRRERIKNRLLKRRLGREEEKYNGTDEMISNYKEMYEINYLRNWAMFLGILIVSIAISKVFNNTSSQISQQPVQKPTQQQVQQPRQQPRQQRRQ